MIVGSTGRGVVANDDDTGTGVDANDCDETGAGAGTATGAATGAATATGAGAATGAGDCFCMPDNSNPNTENPVEATAAVGGGVAGGTTGVDATTTAAGVGGVAAMSVDGVATGVGVSGMGDGGGMTATAGMGKGRGIIAIGGGLPALALPLLASAAAVAGGVGREERAGEAWADPAALPRGGGAFLLSMLIMDLPCTPLPVGRMSGRGGNACKSSNDTKTRKRGGGEGVNVGESACGGEGCEWVCHKMFLKNV